MSKISFLAGVGAGYVLGARAGKQRYEQIKQQADRAWHNDKVQARVSSATETVKAKAPIVGQKAADAAKSGASVAADKVVSAKDTAAEKVAHRGDKDLPETIHRGEDGELHADTTGFGPGGEKLP